VDFETAADPSPHAGQSRRRPRYDAYRGCSQRWRGAVVAASGGDWRQWCGQAANDAIRGSAAQSVTCAMSCETRRPPRLGATCGKDRFPKPSLLKRKLELATPSLRGKQKPCTQADDHSFGYSTNVLIHGWQKRRLQVEHAVIIEINLKSGCRQKLITHQLQFQCSRSTRISAEIRTCLQHNTCNLMRIYQNCVSAS